MARWALAYRPELVQECWDALQAGEFLTQAASRVGTSRATVRRMLHAAGGVRPRRGRNLQGRYLSFLSKNGSANGRPGSHSRRRCWPTFGSLGYLLRVRAEAPVTYASPGQHFVNISSQPSTACQNRRVRSTMFGPRIAATAVLSVLTIVVLSACTPEPREQLASVVECLVEKGWNAELDPNELAYGVETTEDQDFAFYHGDDADCRERAGLPPRPVAPGIESTSSELDR